MEYFIYIIEIYLLQNYDFNIEIQQEDPLIYDHDDTINNLLKKYCAKIILNNTKDMIAKAA